MLPHTHRTIGMYRTDRTDRTDRIYGTYWYCPTATRRRRWPKH
ncbi:hypothetical protein OIU81_24995 [Streptomyces sp. NBC_01454]